MSKLSEVVYCIAYQNHRYDEDEYNLEFFTDWHGYARALVDKRKIEGSKIIEFNFRPIDLIKEV